MIKISLMKNSKKNGEDPQPHWVLGFFFFFSLQWVLPASFFFVFFQIFKGILFY
jgi:hypothetical protein